MPSSDRPNDGPRSPSEPTVDRLVAAARQLFARDGFAATSLDAVAAACGVTKGSLYYHFSGKTELFAAVFEEEQRLQSESVIKAVSGHEDPWEAAYAGISAFLDACDDAGVQRITLLDAPSVLGWPEMREIESRYGMALIRASVEQLVASGQIRSGDGEVLSHLLFGALGEGAMLIAQQEPNVADAKARVLRGTKQLLEGLRA